MQKERTTQKQQQHLKLVGHALGETNRTLKRIRFYCTSKKNSSHSLIIDL